MNFKPAFFITICLFFTFTSCSDDNDDNTVNGSLSVEITDAPIDDATAEGAFVTIAEVKVNGTAVKGFNKTTLDLMAYQNGRTELIFNGDTEVKRYDNITFVLDYETDANGNSPGCYVKDKDGNKSPLTSNGSGEITIEHDFSVMTAQETALLVDFDLRKSIQRENNTGDRYNFVTESELRNALRVVSKDNTGTLKGNCNSGTTGSDKIVVYAYKKGTFNREIELEGQGESEVTFKNAVTSTSVDINGNYELHFLESGEYEIHFAAYEENNNSGQMELKGTLLIDVIGTVNIGSISVNANTTANVNVLVTGLLGL